MSPNSENAGVRVSHGADPKLIRMVRESDWNPRSIIHQQIADPLLIGGHKFHMRINLVITNVSPLEAFVHENGRCIFALKPSTHASRNFGEHFDADAHVVQKDSITKPEALDNYFKGVDGQQIRMRQLLAYLAENHPSFKKNSLWNQILDIATEVAAYLSQGVLKHSRVARDRHFEVFGMDLMLDKNLKVWMCDLDTDSNWGFPKKDMPVSYNPDFTEEVKAFGDIYHDLFTLLGLDAGHKQTQGSLSHWLKIELP
jgi:tubulin polyglutamylase TTLL9